MFNAGNQSNLELALRQFSNHLHEPIITVSVKSVSEIEQHVILNDTASGKAQLMYLLPLLSHAKSQDDSCGALCCDTLQV